MANNGMERALQQAADATFGGRELYWLVVIHLSFVVSGLLMAAMDWLAAQTTRK